MVGEGLEPVYQQLYAAKREVHTLQAQVRGSCGVGGGGEALWVRLHPTCVCVYACECAHVHKCVCERECVRACNCAPCACACASHPPVWA